MKKFHQPLKVIALSNDILYGIKPKCNEISPFKVTDNAVNKLDLIKNSKKLFIMIIKLPVDSCYSIKSCHKLSEHFESLIPEEAFFRYSIDVKKILPILLNVWQTLKNHPSNNKDSLYHLGLRLQRVYEHLSEFEKACEIGEILATRAKMNCRKRMEAIELNNWGFDLALAGRHEEAIEKYEQALLYLRGTFDDNCSANVRANKFFSERYVNPFTWKKNMLFTVATIKSSLKLKNHKRKVLLVEAMYNESNSNFKEAIRLTEEAIELSQKNNTFYDEIDSKYLKYLKCQQATLLKLKEKESYNANC